MLKVSHLTISGKISSHLEFDVSKKLGQDHFYRCVESPLLFTTVCKHLGTEDTSCWTFVGRRIPAAGSSVLGLLCLILRFMMWKTFSFGKRCELQTAPSSTWTLLLRSYAVAIDAVCGLALSCSNMQDLSWKRCHLDGSTCCSKTCTYLSALMVLFMMFRLSVLQTSMHLHIIRDADFSTECWQQVWCWVHLLFSPHFSLCFRKKNV